MTAIYNENDPFAAKWMRGLIAAGRIAPGVVDERSIADLAPADVMGVGQRHFFAGIAGWSHALRLAGVPDDASVWTGSCPCQGLSEAGRRRGFADPRHLWPVWFRLIAECRPPVVFGEQSASSLGLEWLDLVFSDLEGAGYACAAADLCAAGVGAPHRRQRLFFVAYAGGQSGRLLATQWQSRRTDAQAERRGEARELANADGCGRDGEPRHVSSRREQPDAARSGAESSMGDSAGARFGDTQDTRADRGGARRSTEEIERRSAGILEPERASAALAMANATRSRRSKGQHSRQSGALRGSGFADGGRPFAVANTGESRPEVVSEQQARRQLKAAERGGEVDWRSCDWIPCSDGVARPVEPGTHPLSHGVPGRVGLLRGYGNAIVPQVAAQFIAAALEAA